MSVGRERKSHKARHTARHRQRMYASANANAAASAPQSRRLDSVDGLQALTLKGGLLNYCILDGMKTVENRSWVIAPGWYALHTGLGKLSADDTASLHTKIAAKTVDGSWSKSMSANVYNCMEHGICGLVHISHTLPVEKMENNEWASGPFCNVISDVAFLYKSIPCPGNLGLWKPNEAILRELNRQLPRLVFRRTGHEQAFPADTLALETAKRCQNEARAEARRAKKRVREA